MIELISNIGLVILLIIYVRIIYIKGYSRIEISKGKLFFTIFTFFHFLTSFLFAFFLDRLSIINDPKDFYKLAVEGKKWLDVFGLGHDFMAFLIYPLVKIKISIQVLFLLFSVISYKAFIILFNRFSIEEIYKKNKFLLIYFLLPTLHVWTGFLGKESILLLLLIILLNKIQKKKYDVFFLFLLGIIFLLRPHVFIVILFSIFIVILLDKEYSLKSKKIFLGICFTMFSIGGYLFITFFLNFESLNIEYLSTHFENFLQYTENNGGGSAISIRNTGIVTRIGYLLFMPLPVLYEIKTPLQGLVALENIYVISILFYSIFRLIKNKFKISNLDNELRYVLISSLLLIVMFAFYVYNLGQGNRMRIMFYPYLFYFLIRIYSKKKEAGVNVL